MSFKFCSRCSAAKLFEQFRKNRTRSDGLDVYCKPCRQSYDKIWRKANPRKVDLEYHKRWHQAHRETQLESFRKRHIAVRRVDPSKRMGHIRYEARLAGFKSGFERTIAANLTMRKVKFEYETMQIPYTLNGVYNPDFILSNGIIVEAKGLLDRESKRKMVAVKKQHPELDIRMLFMMADKKVPGSKQTHGEWATKNGFQWCERDIPQEWTDE